MNRPGKQFSSHEPPLRGLPAPPLDLLSKAVLFIDFDGTLVDIVERPDAVVVDAALRDLLTAMGRTMPGRVAIVSGRSIAQLDEMLGDGHRLALAGSHGAESRWHDGKLERPQPSPMLPDIISLLEAFAAGRPGVIIEVKTLGVAVHYRMAPSIGAEAHHIVTALAAAHDLAVQHGKMMIELKAADGDKGVPVRQFMGRPEMAGLTPLFIGDDLTDEAGFEAANALGGAGVLVGPPRETAARYGLADVAATRAMLARLIECAT